MLQFRIFSPQLSVYSVQCRPKVKLNNSNVHSSIIVVHERECYNCVCVQFSVGICQRMCRRGVGVSCVLVCRRPWMLSRLQLGTAVVHVQCRKQQEQATYKLKGRYTLKTSTIPLASSSSRAVKQAIHTHIMLGCQSEQEVQGIFRYIYIRLVWFQCKVTILFTVFKLAPAPPPPPPPHAHRGQLQQQSTACTYSPSSPSRRYTK